MYGFYICAYIDEGSNCAPYAMIIMNKIASTLCNVFHEGTAAMQHPAHLRGDTCFAAVRIGRHD